MGWIKPWLFPCGIVKQSRLTDLAPSADGVFSTKSMMDMGEKVEAINPILGKIEWTSA